jgi:D-alanyl-D-alanine-carboxypeptidase/D-alanyl-D-alanine-endopeptidase
MILLLSLRVTYNEFFKRIPGMKLITALLLILTMGTRAAIPEAVKEQVKLRVQHQMNPSIALAVYDQGEVSHFVHGWQNKANNIKADEHTVYEIGSISKTFTGLLLASMATDGTLNIDDPVEQHWPAPFQLRDSSGTAITLQQLSSHVSGLPRLPGNMPLFADDPYAEYGRDDLLKGLADITPGKAGVHYAYSNLAVGLLGETLANAGGASFNALVEQRILQTLSLDATHMTLAAVPEDRLATGYGGEKPTAAWNFKALAGAGSIRSSITDLLAYGVAYLEPPAGLQQAMQLATKVHYQQDGLLVGLGWHVRNGVYWHNGGTGGFRSMLMIDPANGKVVAAITNSGKHDVEDLAIHLMDPSRQMRQHDFPVPIDATALAAYTGTFQQAEGDRQISFVIKDEQLFFTAKKQPRMGMVYVGEDRFTFKMTDVSIQFKASDNGDIEALELHGWGEPQPYRKVPD